ncbi:DUF2147 domain-containing protein, partial [Arthrospira platensis SPKY1]|nr:DUF2147 domain-containing protein [Arthrospira platensis SPKY1]
MFFFATLSAQSVVGKWKTIDDITGEAKSIVQIYEENGMIYGKVIEIFDASKRNRLCENCPGALKNKPVLGLKIINGLEKNGNAFENGKILDPESGKEYKCYISLEDDKTLKVR